MAEARRQAQPGQHLAGPGDDALGARDRDQTTLCPVKSSPHKNKAQDAAGFGKRFEGRCGRVIPTLARAGVEPPTEKRVAA